MINRPVSSGRRLIGVTGAALAALVCLELFGVERERFPEADLMERASALAAEWFRLIEAERVAGGNPVGAAGHTPYAGMIGVEWSEITTTLGSLDAKITAANPAFAGAIVLLLQRAGIDSSATVGVSVSGSFPSLAVSALAALQTVGSRAVVVSSVGASAFGANDPAATWIDMETWLRAKGGLRYASSMVTPGGEADNGGGLSDDGRQRIRDAAIRNGVVLTVPSGFEEALHLRLDLFRRHDVRLVINIGGNQTALGTCVHGITLPGGLSTTLHSCGDSGRGLLVRMAERGIPAVHLLNIRSLAAEFGLPLIPGEFRGEVPPATRTSAPVRVAAAVFALLILFLVGKFRLRRVPLA